MEGFKGDVLPRTGEEIGIFLYEGLPQNYIVAEVVHHLGVGGYDIREGRGAVKKPPIVHANAVGRDPENLKPFKFKR